MAAALNVDRGVIEQCIELILHFGLFLLADVQTTDVLMQQEQERGRPLVKKTAALMLNVKQEASSAPLQCDTLQPWNFCDSLSVFLFHAAAMLRGAGEGVHENKE